MDSPKCKFSHDYIFTLYKRRKFTNKLQNPRLQYFTTCIKSLTHVGLEGKLEVGGWEVVGLLNGTTVSVVGGVTNGCKADGDSLNRGIGGESDGESQSLAWAWE